MKNVTPEKEHAKYSASGSERWLNCPGSIALCEKAPPETESEYAAEGTRAHKCLEYLLKNRKKLAAATAGAKKLWPEDMVKHALGAAVWILERASFGGELLCETKVDATPFTCNGQFGTVDASVVEVFDRLTVADFKYGAGIAVDPEGNSQLAYYALALSHRYQHNFSEVELVIIQPRAYHESGETVRSLIISIEELLVWGPKFAAGVKACEQPKAPLKSGKWCKFCPATSICPELKTKAFKQAEIVFDDEHGVESMPEPRMVKAPNLGVMLEACDKLEAWIKGVRDHAFHVLQHGREVAGFKLVAKRSPRKWANEAAIVFDARQKFGDTAFTTPELLSPAQLEKAAGDVEDLDKWIGERVTTESSGLTLVRDSDKRKAVKAVAQIFADPVERERNYIRKILKGKKK